MTSLTDELQLAVEIAIRAHKGQLRRDGDLYFNHVARVANNKTFIMSTRCKIVAYLHDVVEDTHFTFEDLKELGISDDTIELVKYVTKPKHATYDEYIDNICNSIHAMLVKLSDLEDNSDVETLDKINEKDIKRFKKYEAAKSKINATILAKYPDIFRLIKRKDTSVKKENLL